MRPARVCELCGAADFRLVSDQFRGGRPARILECEQCGLVFQEPAADCQGIYRFYTDEFPGNYQYRSQLNARREALLAPSLRREDDVVEIGCSSGEFLDLIRPRVRSVSGIELVPHDVETARARYGLTIYDRPLEQLDLEQRFDVVLALQTFEHIPAPNEFLRCVRRMLRSNGRLVLEVPNIKEPLLALYRVGAFRRFYFVPQHLFYYSQDTLPRMVAKNGFAPRPPRLIQLSSLTNHLHWIYGRGPQRSLEEVCTVVLPEDVDSAASQSLFQALNEFYLQALVARGYSDTLWLEADVQRTTG